jgi:hypothetical protein
MGISKLLSVILNENDMTLLAPRLFGTRPEGKIEKPCDSISFFESLLLAGALLNVPIIDACILLKHNMES